MDRKEEIKVLTGILTDVPHVENTDIEGAIKAGLTLSDVEWNQRLDRPWTFHPTDAKEESAARVGWFVRNGLVPEEAEKVVASGH